MPDIDEIKEIVPEDVDLRQWVEAGRANPVLYRARQVTEIVLCAIGLTNSLKQTLVLKGGTLMAIAFQSNRVTGDVDFSASVEPNGFEERLVAELNPALAKAAEHLRYIDLICRIQGIKKKPRPQGFEHHNFPALEVHVASARRGTREEEHLAKGNGPRVLKLEISFRDQVFAFRELSLAGCGVEIQSFALTEIIAEKLRALLQQVERNRYRRQDIYDIAYLVERFPLSLDDKAEILATFKKKCASREIYPKPESISNPEVIERARRDWPSLAQEVGSLPPFEERYAIVKTLYETLPW